MDLLIENGDFALTATGRPVIISGIDEIKQKISILLMLRKNSFIYNYNLGSNIHTITSQTPQSELLHIVKSSLASLNYIKVNNVFLKNENNLILCIEAEYNKQKIYSEIVLKDGE